MKRSESGTFQVALCDDNPAGAPKSTRHPTPLRLLGVQAEWDARLTGVEAASGAWGGASPRHPSAPRCA